MVIEIREGLKRLEIDEAPARELAHRSVESRRGATVFGALSRFYAGCPSASRAWSKPVFQVPPAGVDASAVSRFAVGQEGEPLIKRERLLWAKTLLDRTMHTPHGIARKIEAQTVSKEGLLKRGPQCLPASGKSLIALQGYK